jgi:DNA-binding PadR family transcriptional regulator
LHRTCNAPRGLDQEIRTQLPLAPTDFQVLMVLADGPGYGYGIMKAVGEQSGGAIAPEIGSLYRVLARLMAEGWVREVAEPAKAPAVTRGRDRRWYTLTADGRRVLRQEAGRLADAVALARQRRLLGRRAT